MNLWINLTLKSWFHCLQHVYEFIDCWGSNFCWEDQHGEIKVVYALLTETFIRAFLQEYMSRFCEKVSVWEINDLHEECFYTNWRPTHRKLWHKETMKYETTWNAEEVSATWPRAGFHTAVRPSVKPCRSNGHKDTDSRTFS